MTSKPKRRWQFGLGALVLSSGVLPALIWIAVNTSATVVEVIAFCLWMIAGGIVGGRIGWQSREWQAPPRDAFDRTDQITWLVFSVLVGIVAALVAAAVVWPQLPFPRSPNDSTF